MKPTESRPGYDFPSGWRHHRAWSTTGCVLPEAKMSPVLVVVEQIQRHQPFEMPLIQEDYVVQQVAPATSHPALRNPVCQGLRKAVRVGWLPISLTAATTSAPNFASRSKSKNRYGCW
jgi:hypothetical protein